MVATAKANDMGNGQQRRWQKWTDTSLLFVVAVRCGQLWPRCICCVN